MFRVAAALLVCLARVALGDEVATERTNRVVPEEPEDAPARGSRGALVTVEFFCNFANLQCISGERTLRRLSERHADGLRVVYHQVVLPFRDSEAVAQASIEAWLQGRFFAVAEVVAARGGPLRGRDLDALALQAGLDGERLRAAVAQHRHNTWLEADAARAIELGVGTFGAAWNGEPTSDLTLEGMERSYQEARRRAARLIADGVARDRLYPALVREAAARRDPARRPGAADDAPRARVEVGGAPQRGEPDATVTLVTFNDYECPPCRRQEDVLRRLLAAYPDRVRVAWKQFPLPQHDSARAVAELVACAHLQGRFFAVHEAVIEAGGRVRGAELLRIAGGAGLDLMRFRADAAAGRCAAAVDADVIEGRALGVDSTPTLFVNGARLVGLRGTAELRVIIEEESAPGFLERATDTR